MTVPVAASRTSWVTLAVATSQLYPSPQDSLPQGLSVLAQPAEQGRNGPVVEDLADGAGQQRRDRQHGDVVEALLGRQRQRVGPDDLADPAVLEPLGGRGGEARVWGGHPAV